jgi:succinate dehydrogenase / fumarate reductase membrane anchor subunit
MNLRNPLEQARGHGSAKDGVHHWYAQRASALLLIALLAWLLYSMLSMDDLGYEASRAFIANPINAALLSVLLVAALYHAMLGLQVVIEDYVHSRPLEITLYFLTRAGGWIGMALGVVHILKLALGA